ncbi:MAG: EamA family transporter [Candidatus Omnitrophica bacterium]|nr:EamA family transporter [Candidatus Omnitrophota bacterium]MDE2008793.1 EamA family transporter [Candidatus Omnitrophota bacterium]MDE2213644.1 EamA family transporter [Candidatus Omnitrophota bacterium]MDE2230455.1 EamA family transporter [Candidatus Omnitrophota bacterium]
MKTIVLVFIAECLMTTGQICFKKSTNSFHIQETTPAAWIIGLLKCVLKHPLLWMGAAFMLVGLVFWLAALSSGQLNFVYLLGSVQYIFALFAAHFFLQEKIDAPKLAGTLLITLGVILTAMS